MKHYNRIETLLEVMARLRAPEGGCPWDREQTFATIAPYTVEEAYEVADAIERQALSELREELGDLLFQVVFHARIAEEGGHFGFPDVVETVVEKMVRRHPHVFGDEEVEDAEAQTIAWEAQKARERSARAGSRTQSVLDGVAVALPALTRAEKLQKRAARIGFDWPDAHGALEKVREETEEVVEQLEQHDSSALQDELGDLLFACVNLARLARVDPETALRGANSKFERRFRAMEATLERAGRSLDEASLQEMNVEWERVKRSEGKIAGS
ncbi:nucleoside triphosphate pyrophosphohydrolase [Thiohalomonas denitrificans]|uniref:Nucleoside triphosphate pyrophosphohydrolase n=1 Tax=Thiohalomonas denitrificans TaxID=415747 RepID=A0A1G5PQM5_9GAMM|nr:nucleoside triphosphate pyrophosphohydrolase [Thiohalomonas denitrificans]SCZ51722.1 ATP diphosphatase [Thiohalomonas denitrificans]